MDAELVGLAARLAGCPVDAVVVCRRRPDGALVVIVQPGPKYVFDQAAVEAALDEVEVREALRGPLSEPVVTAGVEAGTGARAVVARRPRKPRAVRP